MHGVFHMTFDDARNGFSRLHRVFTFHLGMAVALAWMTALYPACYAPWVRNIRAHIDPAGGTQTIESTWSFLFVLPVVLTIAWLSLFFGGEIQRRSQTLPNDALRIRLLGRRGIRRLLPFHRSRGGRPLYRPLIVPRG